MFYPSLLYVVYFIANAVFWATAVGTVGLFIFTAYYLAIGASSVSAFANIST